METIVKSIYS